jgi:hypothetical protein
MSFKKNKFIIVRNCLEQEICNFLVNYLKIKEPAARYLFDAKYLHPDTVEWGRWDDVQSPGAFSIYGDIAMETLLLHLKPRFEKYTQTKLSPNYSYTRAYISGSILEKHRDRDACQISATINLGGDTWPIYVHDGYEVNLNPGDALVYKGAEVDHWRNKFTGQSCYQVFLHYNSIESGNTISPIYDNRPMLGVPPQFRQK